MSCNSPGVKTVGLVMVDAEVRLSRTTVPRPRCRLRVRGERINEDGSRMAAAVPPVLGGTVMGSAGSMTIFAACLNGLPFKWHGEHWKQKLLSFYCKVQRIRTNSGCCYNRSCRAYRIGAADAATNNKILASHQAFERENFHQSEAFGTDCSHSKRTQHIASNKVVTLHLNMDKSRLSRIS